MTPKEIALKRDEIAAVKNEIQSFKRKIDKSSADIYRFSQLQNPEPFQSLTEKQKRQYEAQLEILRSRLSRLYEEITA